MVTKVEYREVVIVSAVSRGERPQESWESNSCSEEEQKRLRSYGLKGGRGAISAQDTLFMMKKRIK